MKQYKVRFFSRLQDSLYQEVDAEDKESAWQQANKWASDYNKTAYTENHKLAIHSIMRIK